MPDLQEFDALGREALLAILDAERRPDGDAIGVVWAVWRAIGRQKPTAFKTFVGGPIAAPYIGSTAHIGITIPRSEFDIGDPAAVQDWRIFVQTTTLASDSPPLPPGAALQFLAANSTSAASLLEFYSQEELAKVFGERMWEVYSRAA